MLDPVGEDSQVDFDALARAVRRIGLGWLVAIVFFCSLRINVLIGGALIVSGFLGLKSSGWGDELDRRSDELIGFAAVAMAASVVTVLMGGSSVLRPLHMVAPLVTSLAEVRFAVLMNKAMLAFDQRLLGRRWRSASHALLGTGGIVLGVLLVAAISSWVGQPAIDFVDHPTTTWVNGQSVELTPLGIAIVLAFAASGLGQVVVLHRVFQPTKAWIQLQATHSVQPRQPVRSTQYPS